MEESEHRALWGALGVALVIAGVVILSDWTFVAVAAPPQRDLAGLWWPWVGALALMAVGVYVLVAISDERWWLPGRKDLKRRAAIRHKTVKFLARFRAHATLLLLREGLTEKDYQDWITNLCTFVAEAWGIQETMILFPNEVGNVPDVLKESAVRLVALIERCDGMTLKDDYDPDAVPKAEWLVYLDRVFSGTPEELA